MGVLSITWWWQFNSECVHLSGMGMAHKHISDTSLNSQRLKGLA